MVRVGDKVFEKGRVSVYKFNGWCGLGINTCYQMEIYKPETEKKMLSINLFCYEINITLKQGGI